MRKLRRLWSLCTYSDEVWECFEKFGGWSIVVYQYCMGLNQIVTKKDIVLFRRDQSWYLEAFRRRSKNCLRSAVWSGDWVQTIAPTRIFLKTHSKKSNSSDCIRDCFCVPCKFELIYESFMRDHSNFRIIRLLRTLIVPSFQHCRRFQNF